MKWKPRRKTITQRNERVSEARKALYRYRQLMTPPSRQGGADDQRDLQSSARVNALLWAIAHLNRALALETNGHMGDETSTPRRIAEREGMWLQVPNRYAPERPHPVPILQPVLAEG